MSDSSIAVGGSPLSEGVHAPRHHFTFYPSACGRVRCRATARRAKHSCRASTARSAGSASAGNQRPSHTGTLGLHVMDVAKVRSGSTAASIALSRNACSILLQPETVEPCRDVHVRLPPWSPPRPQSLLQILHVALMPRHRGRERPATGAQRKPLSLLMNACLSLTNRSFAPLRPDGKVCPASVIGTPSIFWRP